MTNFRKTIEHGVAVAFVAIAFTLVFGAAWTGFDGAIGLTRQSSASNRIYLNHETANKLTLSTSLTTAPDNLVQVVGQTNVREIFSGAGADQFIPAAADTDFGLGATDDLVLDSLRYVCNDDAAGDTAIFSLYEYAAGTVTLLSTDTCATSPCTVDYTGLTDAQRTFDISSAERRSYFMDERGTIAACIVEDFTRGY